MEKAGGKASASLKVGRRQCGDAWERTGERKREQVVDRGMVKQVLGAQVAWLRNAHVPGHPSLRHSLGAAHAHQRAMPFVHSP